MSRLQARLDAIAARHADQPTPEATPVEPEALPGPPDHRQALALIRECLGPIKWEYTTREGAGA